MIVNSRYNDCNSRPLGGLQMSQTRTFVRKEGFGERDGAAWTDTPADKARKEREKVRFLEFIILSSFSMNG